MALLFVDTDGAEGRIEEDLSVTYFGRLNVEETIKELADELADGADITDELVVRLPKKLPIQEIKRELT